MSYYVKRLTQRGTVAWTGPLRTERLAQREADAWNTTADWFADATVVPATAEVKREVRMWQRERNIAHGRV